MTLAAVAVDLMDTVVVDPYRDALTSASAVPLRELLAARGPSAWPAFERGEMNEDEFFATFSEVGFDVELFHRTRREGYRFVAGMEDLLRDLADRVERVGATNYPIWVEELVDGMLEGLLDRVVASYAIGVRKPSPEFYVRLRDAVGVAAERILFVDDRPENVEAAVVAGLRGHVFSDAEDLRQRLREEGVQI